MFRSRQRRSFRHGIQPKYDRLIKKLKLAVKNAAYGEKPKPVKTHLRNCIIMPEMVGSMCEVYSGKYWNNVEIKCGSEIVLEIPEAPATAKKPETWRDENRKRKQMEEKAKGKPKAKAKASLALDC